MRRRPWIRGVCGLAMAAALLVYLRDPAWVDGVTSGLRPWEEYPPGTLYRWTAGRASFYVPSHVTQITVPLRSVFPGPNGAPVRVEMRDDGRLLATIELTDPNAWVRTPVPFKPYTGSRRFRRIDLRISRVIAPYALGVMTGQVDVR
jgi:hypothetical protein